MPTDLLTATQDAVFLRLEAAFSGESATVYQHVPEGAQPPYVIIGDIHAEPAETKGEESLVFDIGYVSRGEGRLALLAMMHTGRAALDHGAPFNAAALAIEGAGTAAALWQSSDAVGAEDGITYAGLQSYAIEPEAT